MAADPRIHTGGDDVWIKGINVGWVLQLDADLIPVWAPGGAGSITEITSNDGSILVSDPTGPIVDLKVVGGGAGPTGPSGPSGPSGPTGPTGMGAGWSFGQGPGSPNSSWITATQGVDLQLQSNTIWYKVEQSGSSPLDESAVVSIFTSIKVQNDGTPGSDLSFDFSGILDGILSFTGGLFDIGAVVGYVTVQESGPFALIGNSNSTLTPQTQAAGNPGATINATIGDWIGISIPGAYISN